MSSTASKSIPISYTSSGSRTWSATGSPVTYFGMNIGNGDLYCVDLATTSLYKVTALSGSVATLTKLYTISKFNVYGSMGYNFSVGPNGTCVYSGPTNNIIVIGGAYGSETSIYTYTSFLISSCFNPAGTTIYFMAEDWVIRRLNYSGGSWSIGTPLADLYALGILDNIPYTLATDPTGNVYCLCKDYTFTGLKPIVLAIVSPSGTLIGTYTSTVATADANTKISMVLDGNIIWFTTETASPYATKLYKWVVGGTDSLFLGSSVSSVTVHPVTRTVYSAIPSALTLYNPNY